MERIQSIPDAHRTLTGLAHQGYTPQTAIADIIDNSIAAGAQNVHVQIAAQPDGMSVVTIADDGVGMDGATLKSAMQIGSPKNLTRTSLSVYGMGLKAASMSFSRKFSVVSRSSPGAAMSASWDLDTQIENPWTILFGEAHESQVRKLDRLIGENPGTLVTWEKADFKDAILDHRKIRGRKPSSVEDEVTNYLSMIFHRFIEGTAKGYLPVQIFVNGKQLDAFNPVTSAFLDEEWAPIVDEFVFEISQADGSHETVPYAITTYVLSQDEERAKPANLGMRTQGIYPYRGDRLLQSPDWLGVIAFHPDFNPVRVVLEIDPRLDGVTRTDMKKSGLSLPPEMLQNLKEKLDEYTRRVRREKKRKNAQKRSLQDTTKLHRESNIAIANSMDSLEMPQVTRSSSGTVVETIFGASVTELVEATSLGFEGDARIVTVTDLEGGNLFEPRWNGAESVIYLNKSHPFYQKIYLNCISEPIAIQGFDFLLYAMSHAELLTRTDRVRDQFRRMRTEMSEALRSFVLDLEEPGKDIDMALEQEEENFAT